MRLYSAGEIQKDLAWGALLGFLFAVSPLSSASRVIASVVGGVFFAGFVVGFRGIARRRAPALLSPPMESALFARPTLPVWGLLAATLLVFLPTLHWLYGQYTVTVWRNAHGLFLPVIVVVLARSRLRRDPSPAEASSAWGTPLIVLGALLAVLDAGVRSGFLGAIGLLVALLGLSFLLLGAARTRLIAFPLALCVFLLPLPEELPNPLWLPSGTAFMVEQYFGWLGIPSARLQTYFKLSVGFFNVSTNCSGLSAFYAASLLSLILVSTTRSWGRRALILLSVWPMTVLINGVRGAVLIGLCNRYGLGISDTAIHGISGILTVMALLCALLALADWRAILKVKA
jgi:exosortase